MIFQSKILYNVPFLWYIISKEGDKNMNSKTINILKNSERYKDFTILENPVSFTELFRNKDFEVVQLHSIELAGENDVVGFCGVCSWKENVLEPLDGDSYYAEMPVFGYATWSNKEQNIEKGLDILVEEW